MAVTASVSEQLRERAHRLRVTAERLRSVEVLALVRTVAEDPQTWGGDLQRAFCGWLDSLTGWVRMGLARAAEDAAAAIERHRRDLDDALLQANLGMGSIQPPSVRAIASVPPPPPVFDMQLPAHPKRAAISAERLRVLAKALNGAGEALLELGRQIGEATAPIAAPAVQVAPPISSHLPPDMAESIGWPTSYRAAAEQLARARQDLLRRAIAWEKAATADAPSAPKIYLSGLHLMAADVGPLAARKQSPAPSRMAEVRAPTEKDRSRHGASDAKRIYHKLDSGFFDIPDPEGARRLLAEAAQRAADDPYYATGFLRKLGPKGLRRLIDNGMNPCDLYGVVAAATVVQTPDTHRSLFGTDFLEKALGKGREGARRAAILGACSCPPAGILHPAWTAKLATTLYGAKGSWLEQDRDPRPWFREVGARLVTQLDPAPPGLEKEAEDALEELVAFTHLHPFDSPGNLALAHLLTRKDTLWQAAQALSLPGAPPSASGFAVHRQILRAVLARLTADPMSGPVLQEAAGRFAQERLTAQAGPFVVDLEDPEARKGLASVGAFFGALASRSYDGKVAIKVADVGADAVKRMVEHLADAALKVVKTTPVVSVGVEAGKSILFALGGAALDQGKAAREALESLEGQAQRGELQARLLADLQHLAYVSLLTDPTARRQLRLNLNPNAFPREIPKTREGHPEPLLSGITLNEWKRRVFPDGNLYVPDPISDPVGWRAFLAWSSHVNPRLDAAAGNVYEQMHGAFSAQVGQSQ